MASVTPYLFQKLKVAMRKKAVFSVLFVYASAFIKSAFMEARCYVNATTTTIYPVCFITLQLQAVVVVGLNKREGN